MPTQDNYSNLVVKLPNPSKDPNTFSERLSQWALHDHADEADKGRLSLPNADDDWSSYKGARAGGDLLLDGNQLLKVSLGYCWKKRNGIARRKSHQRHMGMVLEAHPIDEDDGQEQIVNKCTCTTKNKKLVKLVKRQKPIWAMNCCMGDEDDHPLVLEQDVVMSQPQRPHKTSSSVQKEWLKAYHMKAMTFASLLRRLIRWGSAVGSLSLALADLSNLNRQHSSVALLTTWWMQEACHHVGGGGRLGITSTETAGLLATIREPAILYIVAPSIARTIHMKTHPYVDNLFGKQNLREEEATKEQLIDFLFGDEVASIMAMNDEEVTNHIGEWEMGRKRNSSGTNTILGKESGGDHHAYDTSNTSGTFSSITFSSRALTEEEDSTTPSDNNDRQENGAMTPTLRFSQAQAWLGDGPTSEEYEKLPSFLLKMSKQARAIYNK